MGQQTIVQFLVKQILLWKKFNYEHPRDSCIVHERSVIDFSWVSYIRSLAECLNLAKMCFGRLCVARKQMWSRGLKSFSGLAPTLKHVKIISWQLLEVHVSTDNIFSSRENPIIQWLTNPSLAELFIGKKDFLYVLDNWNAYSTFVPFVP